MSTLMTFHGEIRWLAALVALIALGRYGLGWSTRLEFGRLDRVLMATFTGLLDLNLLLGLILLFGLAGGLPAHRLEHAVTMLLAVAVAHSAVAWKRLEDSRRKFRNNLVTIAIALALVGVGVIRLRGGWLF